MPVRDIYHNPVKNALIKDGWTITDDPLILSIGKKDVFVDLGAEKLIAAEKENQKIAVEIKSFIGKSQVNDLENALGQYILYHEILLENQEDRLLFLALKKSAYEEIFEEPIGKILIKRKLLKLIVFDENKEVILQWIN
ncbi:element excision factor XisH family protein [Geminocystis sp. GBBB08]|uniref:element excision factor XisH family protein n=1 Tax=Geminocystis sp. GBBB08 TaxID=2604140 RepID=UPI0027E2A724|nr:element excision factor XisH family protein [Geminocystis sp. GBBB08]MBL1208382.1 fatty-acid synthase [Geminocystis sp. GBBB08]